MDMKKFGKQVATHLGGNFFVDGKRSVGAGSVVLGCNTEDAQFAIFLSHDESKKKIFVRGGWPKAVDDAEFPYSFERPDLSIGVSELRSADAVAREIERRFLPDYRATFKVGAARRDQHNEYIRRRDAYIQIFEELLRGKRRDPKSEIVDGGPRVGEELGYVNNFMVMGDSVQFELRSVPVPVAVRILKEWLKDWPE